MKKIYISGAISNNPNYKADFETAAQIVETVGFEVINPAGLGEIPAGSWADYMRRDIKLLMDCDGVYMLPGWHESKGAQIEHQLARDLGLNIYYEDRSDRERNKAK